MITTSYLIANSYDRQMRKQANIFRPIAQQARKSFRFGNALLRRNFRSTISELKSAPKTMKSAIHDIGHGIQTLNANEVGKGIYKGVGKVIGTLDMGVGKDLTRNGVDFFRGLFPGLRVSPTAKRLAETGGAVAGGTSILWGASKAKDLLSSLLSD